MKRIYILTGLMLLVASATAATSKSERVQMVVRQQANGEWQMYTFGLPPCPSPMTVHVINPNDQSQPLQVACSYDKK